MFDFKAGTGFVVAKKILGSCLGVDATRRDKKSDRKHYHTILLRQGSLHHMASTFGADLRRSHLPLAFAGWRGNACHTPEVSTYPIGKTGHLSASAKHELEGATLAIPPR